LQQLRLSNSGPGSLTSGSGSSGSGTSGVSNGGPGDGTITLPRGGQGILQNGKVTGSNNRAGHTSIGTSGRHRARPDRRYEAARRSERPRAPAWGRFRRGADQ